MEQITSLAALLGEENEKKIKDTITDMLIAEIQLEFNSYNDYLINFDDLAETLHECVKNELKEKFSKNNT